MNTNKLTSLEMIIHRSKNIPIFKDMDAADICELVYEPRTKTVNKGEYIAQENVRGTQIRIVLYGSFDVFVKKNKVAELHEGDMSGLGSFIRQDSGNVSKTTVIANSYKNLLLSFMILPKHIEPSVTSSRFYQNIAKYFAHKISMEHMGIYKLF